MADERTERPSLRRSRSDRILGGVAAGIANHFGIDPILVRLGFVLLTIAGGSGVLIYLIAWLIIPEEGEGEEQAPRRSGPALDAGTTRLLLGGILIAIGGILLASRFIPYFSEVFWPLAFIVAGAAVIMGAARR